MIPTDLTLDTAVKKYSRHFVMPLTALYTSCVECKTNLIYSKHDECEYGPKVIAAHCPNGHGWWWEGI